MEVGVLQGSVLGPLLFAVYYSPVADVIMPYGVQYHASSVYSRHLAGVKFPLEM